MAADSWGDSKFVEPEAPSKLSWSCRAFWDKRISQEVLGDALGEEFKGYVFKITGGCDKQGFPVKQGVLTPGRVRLLLHRVTYHLTILVALCLEFWPNHSENVFNDPTSLTYEELYDLRNRWATCFLDLYNPVVDDNDADEKA
ncbi:hypothetical protein TSUD_403270 [Trifolium subterraneum]|uniref:Uncharacterized protein n=1 Tax=Trifolium subterraneum TaxID=3900 RepID=A0A2Z6PN03_TRISU|nr:hypothetical protein TSUD_403270 [Trifolium subterraneum]